MQNHLAVHKATHLPTGDCSAAQSPQPKKGPKAMKASKPMKAKTKSASKPKAMNAPRVKKAATKPPTCTLNEQDFKAKLKFPGTKARKPLSLQTGTTVYTETHKTSWRVVLTPSLERRFSWKADPNQAWAKLVQVTKEYLTKGTYS